MGEFWFFIEVLIGGVLAGVMYSLVALGFVLIFKASGVFNFAQGVMVLFAALTFVGLMEKGVPMFLALLLTIGVMVLVALAIERVVLRHLVNQEQIILFMATIGIAFFLEGFGETLWGSDVRALDIGLPNDVWFMGDAMIQKFDLIAAAAAACWSPSWRCFSTTRGSAAPAGGRRRSPSGPLGGHSLNQIWVIVWAVAGFVALVAGIAWGARLGVQFSLSVIALKALPVLILGGFTSVPGNYRRHHHWRRREAGGDLYRPDAGRRD